MCGCIGGFETLCTFYRFIHINMIAPEPYLSAYLHVVQRAVLTSRLLARENQGFFNRLFSGRRQEQIADLQDAIHVVLELLPNWERCDEDALRKTYLEAFDTKWHNHPPLGLRLLPTLLEKLNTAPSL